MNNISININNFGSNKLNRRFKVKDKDNKIIDKIIKIVPFKERYKFFNEDELNSLEYKDAIKIDSRSFFKFYLSLLKQTHLIIFTFFIQNDYNILLLKISLFLITFALFIFMNAIFFRDDSIHKIYEDGGKYNIIYQLPQTLYSTIVTQVISFLLEKLSLSQDNILRIKEKKNLKIKSKEILKCIKIKCIIFLIIGIALLFLFWYYLSAFCAVFYNTQIPLIKDSCISFFTSLIYPFGLDLLPVIFRIIGLRYKNKISYTFSNIVTKIIGII